MISSPKPDNIESKRSVTFKKSLEFTLAPKGSLLHPSASLSYWSLFGKAKQRIYANSGFPSGWGRSMDGEERVCLNNASLRAGTVSYSLLSCQYHALTKSVWEK